MDHTSEMEFLFGMAMVVAAVTLLTSPWVLLGLGIVWLVGVVGLQVRR